MGLSFVSLGLFVAVAGRAVGLTEETLAQAGAVMMILFGIVLLVPRLSRGFELATAGMASRADSRMDNVDQSGLKGQFLGGMLLGAVWSPCVGPTLGGAISLASQGESLLMAGAIMTSFALGIGTIIVALGYGTRNVILGRQAQLRRLAGAAKPIMGIIFLLVGVMILFNFHHIIEGWFVDHLPYWLQDLSVVY